MSENVTSSNAPVVVDAIMAESPCSASCDIPCLIHAEGKSPREHPQQANIDAAVAWLESLDTSDEMSRRLSRQPPVRFEVAVKGMMRAHAAERQAADFSQELASARKLNVDWADAEVRRAHEVCACGHPRHRHNKDDEGCDERLPILAPAEKGGEKIGEGPCPCGGYVLAELAHARSVIRNWENWMRCPHNFEACDEVDEAINATGVYMEAYPGSIQIQEEERWEAVDG